MHGQKTIKKHRRIFNLHSKDTYESKVLASLVIYIYIYIYIYRIVRQSLGVANPTHKLSLSLYRYMIPIDRILNKTVTTARVI